MPTYQQNDALCDITVKSDPMYATALDEIYLEVQAIKSDVPGVTRIRLLEETETPLEFRFWIWHTDGRIWKQTMMFQDQADTDPSVGFNISDLWMSSELSHVRSLRVMLAKMVNEYYATDFDVQYN